MGFGIIGTAHLGAPRRVHGDYDYLVTGGMGFIGRHTIAELRRQHPQARIVSLDNLATAQQDRTDPLTEFVAGDVADTSLVNHLVSRCKTAVIHLAADSRVLPSLHDPAKVLDTARTNIIGTANILAAMTKTIDPLTLVYAGSSTAYGDTSVPQTETDLPSVKSPYAATKLAGELLIRSFAVTFGLDAVVLRYFQVYGPGQPTEGAYALVTGVFMRQYAAGQPLTIEGDGTQTRDFVHVADVARANVAALGLRSSGGLPINIGSGQMHSVAELADLISLNQVHVPARRIDLAATCADITAAKSLLGWEPEIKFADGIHAMLATLGAQRREETSGHDMRPGPYLAPKPDPADPCHRGQCYSLLRHCIELCEPGYGLEFGVQTGHSLELIARRLYGVGFDSFNGLPEPWGPYPKGMFAHHPPAIPNTRIVVGWFADTLPTFDFTTVQPLRLIHIDCDLYSSTKTVLEHLGPHLAPGTILVFDEYLYDWPPNEARGGDEQRAWRDFTQTHPVRWKVIGHAAGAWAIQVA